MAKYFRSIRFRLWCLAALFFVPQIFQISIIVRRAQTDIVFTEKERLGTAYLKAVWPLKNAVDRSVARIVPLGPIEPLIEGLEKARAAYDADLETGAESEALMKAIRSVWSLSDHDHINDLIFALVTRIGDKSNLILDPDLDTYYLMSLVVERLPELSRDAAKANLALEIIRKEGITPEAIDQLKFTEASFAISVAKVAHGIRLALASTVDASLNGRMSKPYADLAVITRQIAELYRQAGARMQGNGPLSAALAAQISEKRDIFRSRIDDIYKLTLSELDRLLAARITKQESARNLDLTLAGLFMVVALGIAALLSSTIMRNLRRLRFSLDAMGNGDFSANIAALERKDELGGLARAVQRVRDTITAKLHEDFSTEKVSLVRDEQRRIIAGMASDLDHAVTGSVLTIGSLGSELTQTAGFVSNSTAATRRAINTSVEALDSSVANVRAATISLSELAMSVSEISGQASRAADATRIARERALEAKTRSAELDKTVSEIQASAKLVESIAAQTNLLALNATIEAARAGEAGRGFAVVAQEVKMLAAQSARTTAEIQARIIAVSQVSHSVTSAIDEMGETIDRMDEVSLSIAAAVEQHNVTTAEITARVQETADGADQVARQITDVSAMADSTDEVASSLSGLADKLSEEANILRRESTRFMSRLVG